MALADDEKWILAANLKRQEKEEIVKVERGEDASGGDFGAYHGLLTGKHPEWVEKHAVTEPGYLAAYSRQLKELARGLGLREKPSILDVGCGPGFLTRALLETFGGRALGVDISESAVAYARRRYPDCRFEALAVDETMSLAETFDLVHAREFYPFTRTGDADFHAKYLEILARRLGDGGVLALTLAAKPKSLADHAAAMTPALERLGLAPFQRAVVADYRLLGALSPAAARTLTTRLEGLRGRPVAHFYLARRRSLSA